METIVPSIIEEMEQYKPIHYATTSRRFVSYFIDTIVYFLLSIVFIFILLILDGMYQSNMAGIFINEEVGLEDKLLAYLFYYIIYFSMYSLSEGLFRGRSLGKLITGTRAVKVDNSPISWKDALRRSLIRLIPMEPFSALGSDGLLHDRLSKTMVVKTRG